jgi:hypothetical protein
MFEPAAPARVALQVPFPSKPKSDVPMHEPRSVEPAMAPAPPTDLEPAPILRNPYEPPATVAEEVSLSPQGAPVGGDFGAQVMTDGHESEWHPGPQSQPPRTAYFDAMWPAETKPAKPAAEKNPAGIAPAPQAPKQRQSPEPRSVAILKSGVVDGMGYTLYVDGSIEAELPQGTLRFASINELRSHLENNT